MVLSTGIDGLEVDQTLPHGTSTFHKLINMRSMRGGQATATDAGYTINHACGSTTVNVNQEMNGIKKNLVVGFLFIQEFL